MVPRANKTGKCSTELGIPKVHLGDSIACGEQSA